MSSLTGYTSQEIANAALGQRGSILVTGTTAVTCIPAASVFVAIQFIEDTVFGTLTAEVSQMYPASDGASTSIDANAGSVATAVTFPQGMTIFGRWTKINLASGACVAYVSG